ncbi:MAG: hypothetical protein BECKG1743D_GA0114223_108451 [Candidatus Kentron sp. G]|nr:MAG: hypothetical protein BECKG1743F_GA0114225_106792 [Candidatus Kentron sp. G]VFN04034.1 MAG: hypothetical protein BECKG1743E_GA0114224_106832 [Candidatus Kentron sp. G]VFN06315.1 MAG: hypothetical protein BECKG1743D_GA0114223_108451 [Candidatus Kentron sp. G]
MGGHGVVGAGAAEVFPDQVMHGVAPVPLPAQQAQARQAIQGLPQLATSERAAGQRQLLGGVDGQGNRMMISQIGNNIKTINISMLLSNNSER